MNEEKAITKFPLLSENAYLAILPFAGYLIAYLYQFSFLKYFGLPADFIELNVEKIIIAIISVSLYALMFPIWRYYVKKIETKSNFRLLVIVPFLNSLYFTFILIITEQYTAAIIGFALLLIFITSNDVLPLLKNIKKNGLKQSLKNHVDYEIHNLNYFEQKILSNEQKFITLLLAVYLICLSTIVGEYSGKTKKYFLTLAYQNKHYALITHYKENLIFKEINLNQSTFEKKLLIMPVSEAKILEQMELKEFKINP